MPLPAAPSGNVADNGNSAEAGSLNFVTGGASSSQGALSITTSDWVGISNIGYASIPISMLDVVGNSDTRITVQSSDTTSGNYTGFQVEAGSGSPTFEGGLLIPNNNKTVVELWSQVDTLNLTSTGSVGIGTTTPAGTFDVESTGTYAGYFDNVTTGAGYAIYGVTTGSGNSGYGVYGIDNSASGYGGYFKNTSTGYALYASGNANITGSAQIGSTSASCASGNAGTVQYTSGVLKACVATGSTYTWIPISSGTQLIPTQTTLSGTTTSLQFTSLPTYNTLFLNCSGLLTSNTAATLLVQIGESTGPTWETGAHYTGLINTLEVNETTFTNTDLTDGANCTGTCSDTSGNPTFIQLYLYNPGSSSLYKYSTWTIVGYAGGAYMSQGYGYWDNGSDTSPVTRRAPSTEQARREVGADRGRAGLQ